MSAPGWARCDIDPRQGCWRNAPLDNRNLNPTPDAFASYFRPTSQESCASASNANEIRQNI